MGRFDIEFFLQSGGNCDCDSFYTSIVLFHLFNERKRFNMLKLLRSFSESFPSVILNECWHIFSAISSNVDIYSLQMTCTFYIIRMLNEETDGGAFGNFVGLFIDFSLTFCFRYFLVKRSKRRTPSE